MEMPSPEPSDGAGHGIFAQSARRIFAASYPETPHILKHELRAHPLLEREAMARLAERLPARSIEYNRGDLPIGVDGKPQANGLSIGETIRDIANSGSWAVLKNIEQDPAYAALLEGLLEELQGCMEIRTGEMLTPQGFIFISSPNAVTPYHFDPEHNILLQIEGSKIMTQFPAGDPRYAPDTAHESYHTGGPRELRWNEGLEQGGTPFPLHPGDAIYVPVMAPHHVKVGPEPSVSLSITWRSEWSYAEADARCFNALLRKKGFSPRATSRWPRHNLAKAFAWRAIRRICSLH
ncbi:transcriptional regulator [Tsuneonella sp. CC-YZS046]|uniref:transcriptional regulator n=1 Tax=Tsuneonella sp. CC-YZS046 TaxID=3042152 RepID=UPI002D76C842|nr:transcriptional regulator [Tsuneonella sp. CC-YZS046]WRO68182.1 transcriptional regulator [Tsuneonella sp. CC-YZS046]